jgi:hypothetical protein
MGHTEAYCKTVSYRTKELAKRERVCCSKVVPDSKVAVTTAASNPFAGLDLDGSSDEEEVATPRSPKVVKPSAEAPGAPIKEAPVRLSLAQRIKLNWADDSEDEDEE